MLTIPHVQESLANGRRNLSFKEIPIRDIRLHKKNAGIRVEDKAYRLRNDAKRWLAQHAGIPYPFFRDCEPDLQAILFERCFPRFLEKRGNDESVYLIIEDDSSVVSINESKLALLSSEEILELVLEHTPEKFDVTELRVPKFELNGTTHITIVAPRISSELRPGDIVQGGIDIYHSETGLFGTRIESYLLRLVCRNGLVVRICTRHSEFPTRIRRAGEKNRELTRHRIGQMARVAWDEVDAKLSSLNQLARDRVKDVSGLVRSTGENLRFPARLIDTIIAAISQDEVEPSNTVYDVVNAISRVGTHDDSLSPVRRRYLQELAGELIVQRLERCPTCGDVVRPNLRFLPRR